MDVDEDSEQQQQQPESNGAEMNGGSVPNGEASEQPKRRMKLTYEEYRTIANMIVIHMRQEEDRAEEGERQLS